MKKNHNGKGNKQIRQLLTSEAARLMYEEGIGQYHTAKWRAAKRLFARGGKNIKAIRTRDLPSNGEISQAVYQLATFYEGDTLVARLFAMRVAALDVMERLMAFSPKTDWLRQHR